MHYVHFTHCIMIYKRHTFRRSAFYFASAVLTYRILIVNFTNSEKHFHKSLQNSSSLTRLEKPTTTDVKSTENSVHNTERILNISTLQLSGQQNNLKNFCPSWDVDFSRKLKPLIDLDRTKFLTPVLTYGPNNQLRGFRETVWLAIKLNRSIVVPPFFKHDRTDGMKKQAGIIPPVHRIDIEKLGRLVPVVSSEMMSNLCDKPGKFDVFFNTRRKFCSSNKMSRINNLTSWMKM